MGWCQSATQFGRSTICAAWFIFWKEKFEGLTVSPVLNLNPTFWNLLQCEVPPKYVSFSNVQLFIVIELVSRVAILFIKSCWKLEPGLALCLFVGYISFIMEVLSCLVTKLHFYEFVNFLALLFARETFCVVLGNFNVLFHLWRGWISELRSIILGN